LSRRLLTLRRLGRRAQPASLALRISAGAGRVSCLARQSLRLGRKVSRCLGGVESLVALEAGSVSACPDHLRLWAVPQLTGCLVERSVHRAVDDAGLETSVCVAESNRGAHDTVVAVALTQWCLRSSVSWSSAGLSLAVRAAGLQVPRPPNLPRHSDTTTISYSKPTVYKGWPQIWQIHSAR
jgi:hypothetical protein